MQIRRLAIRFGYFAILTISTAAFGQVPIAPANVRATCQASTTLGYASSHLTWDDMSNNETSFRIWRSPQGGASVMVDEVPAGTTDWGEDELPMNASFCYTVTAHNAAGPSASQPPVCVYSLPEPPFISPTPGQNVVSNSVTLRWNPVTNANRYSVRFRLGTTCGGEIAETGATEYTISNVASGTYSWGVIALNVAGTNASSSSDGTQCWTFHVNQAAQDTQSPTITITQPTTDDTYTTPHSEIELDGTASDNVGVTQVTWNNSTSNQSGTCVGASNWGSFPIPLEIGENYITVRARDAANNQGTDNITVTYAPPSGLPTVTIAPITEISGNSATCGGIVTNEGASGILQKGVCWNTTGYPNTFSTKTTQGAGGGIFNSFMTGLAPGTTYYIRAYATNSAGTAYSSQSTFSTTPASGILPTVTIGSITNITQLAASGDGEVTAEGGSPVSERGFCWNTTGGPTVENFKSTHGTGPGSFTGNLNGLMAGTTYYVRAYATNSAGSGYSDQLVFTTVQAPRYTLTLMPIPVAGGNILANPSQPAGGYPVGAVVTLTAVPFVGYHFNSWSGGVTGINATTNIVMYENKTVAATFGATPSANTAWFGGKITDAATGAGIPQVFVQWGVSDVLTDAGGNYVFNAVPCATRTLRVTKSGYGIIEESYTPPCNQNTSRNIVLTRATVKLTVQLGKEGSGRIKVNGVTQDLPWSGSYTSGTPVALEAAPQPGWSLDYWEREGVNHDNGWNQTLVFDADTALTAHYVQTPDFQLPAYRQDNPFWRAGNAPKSTNFPDDIAPKIGKSRGYSTWYVYGRLMELGYDRAALDRFAGASASDFDNIAKGGNPSSPVIPWSSTEPRVGCIAQRESGHVAVVERINSDGSLVVSESSAGETGGNSDYLYRESTQTRGSFGTYIYVPTAGAAGQSAPCGAMGNCGATGITTLALSFIGLGILRKRRGVSR